MFLSRHKLNASNCGFRTTIEFINDVPKKIRPLYKRKLPLYCASFQFAYWALKLRCAQFDKIVSKLDGFRVWFFPSPPSPGKLACVIFLTKHLGILPPEVTLFSQSTSLLLFFILHLGESWTPWNFCVAQTRDLGSVERQRKILYAWVPLNCLPSLCIIYTLFIHIPHALPPFHR